MLCPSAGFPAFPGAQPDPDPDAEGFLPSPWETLEKGEVQTLEKGEVPSLLINAPQEEPRH